MKFNIYDVLKYIISLGLAIGLFAWLYQDVNMGDVFARFADLDYRWIGVSFAVYLLSHISRGWRWSLMLEPLGYRIGVLNPFLAVMVGYLANFVVPRMGEVARCGILKKTDDVPVNVSFGAVVAERVFDLMIMILITVVTIFVESDKLGALIGKYVNMKAMAGKLGTLVGLGVIGLVGLGILFLMRNQLKTLPLYGKIATFLGGLKDGMLSVLKMDSSKKAWFLFHTVLIWVCYYFTSYALFFTTPMTSDLDLACALSVLAMSGLSMVVPVQGGIGVYHLLVGATLVVYGLDEKLSKGFTLLMHSTQMVVMIVIGLISLVWSLIKSKKTETLVHESTYVS